jgi:hypothetical protein
MRYQFENPIPRSDYRLNHQSAGRLAPKKRADDPPVMSMSLDFVEFKMHTAISGITAFPQKHAQLSRRGWIVQ